MRKWVVVAQLWVVGVLVATWAGEAANTPPAKPFPDSGPGRVAAAWFAAFNGDDDAARAFFREEFTPEALARRSVEERLEVWKSLRAEHGALTPHDVTGAGAASLTVAARAERGAELSMRFEFDEAAPHRFRGVRIEAHEPGEDGVAAGPPLTEAEVVEALGAHADSLAGAGSFSGTLLLAKGDRPLLHRAYGEADRAAKRANRPDTKFNLGSINKVFTQVAVYQLAERGRVRLDETIDRYLPDYPKEKGSKITVRMLLQHRGGTGDIFNERYEANRSKLRSSRDWYRFVRDQALDFEPGTREEYSNVGYVLLAAIVEAVSGEDYYDYVRNHIFELAGMTATASYPLAEKTPNRAVGYTRRSRVGGAPAAGAELRPNVESLPARGSGAGGGYSTAEDLLKFANALRNGTLLGPEHSARMSGLGVAGGSPGVNAMLDMIGPYTLVVLANLDPPAAERTASAARGWIRRLKDAREASGPAGRAAEHDAEGPLAKPQRSLVPPGGIDVPMTIAGHLPAVEIMVNGKGPYRFGIDTGGQGALRVDDDLARDLGMPEVGEVWGGDPSGQNRIRMRLVGVDSISIGGATFAAMHSATRAYGEPGHKHDVDGILGFGLFDGYTVTFDYPAGRLRIEPKELPPVNGADVIAYTDEDGIPSIDISVDSLRMSAHVDAGSMGGFILPERLLESLPLAAEPEVIGRARTVSNTFEIKGAPLRGTLRIGGIEFVDPKLEFQPIMPDANVGSRILKDFRVSFDTRNKRVRFSRAS
ncbi:MAG TPA: serine hydrolase [Candidatus Eisenbacteria bacterium]|nr:serine hydrolase [Candidatus Eisenbacteria bacterium]